MAISIHVPRERDDPCRQFASTGSAGKFQSTSLVRGTTGAWFDSDVELIFQSTSLVRGTTIASVNVSMPSLKISIHVPRERDDRGSYALFQGLISIHVPRERDDHPRKSKCVLCVLFQSTSLVRGTTDDHPRKSKCVLCVLFQSTSLVRGTTSARQSALCGTRFQSTSLVRGTTRAQVGENSNNGYFNPRPS